MNQYHFGADLLDTFQTAPDAIKALALVLMIVLPAALLLGTLAIVLHHLRRLRRIERDYDDLREARQAQQARWQTLGEPDYQRRLEEALPAPPPLPKPLSETHRRLLLGKRPRDDKG